MDVKQLLTAVGQQGSATTEAGEPQRCDQERWQRKKAVKTCVDNGIDLMLVPCGSLDPEADGGLIVRIDDPCDHACSRGRRRPMRWSTREPTRTHQISASGYWASRRSDAVRALSAMT